MEKDDHSETLSFQPGSAEIGIKKIHIGYIEEMIRVHKQAFRGYLNTRLGDGYLRAFLGWFINSEKGLVLGALNGEGHLVGYVMGAPLGYGAELNIKILPSALLGALTHFWLFGEPRFLKVAMKRLGLKKSQSQQTLYLPSPAMSLVGIGVLPGMQGKKVGEALMGAFEAEAVGRGMKALSLSVYPDNLAARRLYEKMEWLPYTETINPGDAMVYYKRLL